MKKYVIIVAGGSGKRMGTTLPKQFLCIGEKPILMHTINRFHTFDSEISIIVVLPEEEISTWKDLCQKHHFSINHTIVKGGKERFDSVKNGLQKIEEKSIVAIHDGVRPFVSNETLKRCFSAAERGENIVPVISPVESVRIKTNDETKADDRTKYLLVQTPQIFSSEKLFKAYNQPYNSNFTDDASVVESIGEKISIAEGNRENIKITTPFDLIVGEALVCQESLLSL